MATDVAILRNGYTIRHENRQEIGELTRLYLSVDRASFVDVPTADVERFERDDSPPPEAPIRLVQPALPATRPGARGGPLRATPEQISDAIGSASARYRLDPDFVSSVISAESGFNSRAVSPKGAQGLMQLMPGTASQLGVDNAFDPAKNTDGGTRYLRMLLERFNFDVAKALAAYNAGPLRVDQHHGVPPYRETRKYVARIINDYNRKKIAQGKTAAKASGTKTAAAKTPAKAAATTASPRKAASSAARVTASSRPSSTVYQAETFHQQ